MKKILKITVLTVLVLLALLQFYPRPVKNTASAISSNDITIRHSVPVNVQEILQVSCYDCHSNNTRYPWYSRLQPVAWWLGDHIREGKAELNFSEFGAYSLRRQYHKLEEMEDQVKEDEMPLTSYTLIHRAAKLSSADKATLSTWTLALRDSFEANYPPDSLKRKK